MKNTTITKICSIALDYNRTISEAAREFGISRPTFYAWYTANHKGIRQSNIIGLENYVKHLTKIKGVTRATSKFVLDTIGTSHLCSRSMPVKVKYHPNDLCLNYTDITSNPIRFARVTVQLAMTDISANEAYDIVKKRFFKNRVRRPNYRLQQFAYRLNEYTYTKQLCEPIDKPIYIEILNQQEISI